MPRDIVNLAEVYIICKYATEMIIFSFFSSLHFHAATRVRDMAPINRENRCFPVRSLRLSGV